MVKSRKKATLSDIDFSQEGRKSQPNPVRAEAGRVNFQAISGNCTSRRFRRRRSWMIKISLFTRC